MPRIIDMGFKDGKVNVSTEGFTGEVCATFSTNLRQELQGEFVEGSFQAKPEFYDNGGDPTVQQTVTA